MSTMQQDTRVSDQICQARTLTAFCSTQPDPEAVTRFLKRLGLHLSFFLPADETNNDMEGLPFLPAQYHFEDEVGTQVEYLAGTDVLCLVDDNGNSNTPIGARYQSHASRFWITAGGHELVVRRVQDALAHAWVLNWLDHALMESQENAA